MEKPVAAYSGFIWAQSCRTARSQIAAIRFNADYDHFYERNQRCFAKSE